MNELQTNGDQTVPLATASRAAPSDSSTARRDKRLAAPRRLTDPKHGFLGTFRRTATTADLGRFYWIASHEGRSETFTTSRDACAALYHWRGLKAPWETAA